jgi:hypothetical protein
MTAACSLCSTPQPTATAEWHAWICERCNVVVRGCLDCTTKLGAMVVRGRLAGRHEVECPKTGQ